MNMNPFSPRTPNSHTWQKLMWDDDDDDGDGGISVHSGLFSPKTPGSVYSGILTPKTPGSLSAFWNVLATAGDEDVELRADSYDENTPEKPKLETKTIVKDPPIVATPKTEEHEDDGETVNTASSKKKIHWQYPIHITKNFHEDPEEDESTIRSESAFSFQNSADKLLDLMEEKVCKFDSIKSMSLRGFEDKIVKHVDETSHPVVWDVLGGNVPGDETSNISFPITPGFDARSFEFDPTTAHAQNDNSSALSAAPSTAEEICADLDADLDRIAEMEKRMEQSKNSSSQESSKYKDLLRTSGSLLNEVASSEEVLKDLASACPSDIVGDTTDPPTVQVKAEKRRDKLEVQELAPKGSEPSASQSDIDKNDTKENKSRRSPPSTPLPLPQPITRPVPVPVDVTVDDISDTLSVLTDAPAVAALASAIENYDPFANEDKSKMCLKPPAVFSPKKASLIKFLSRSFSGTASTSMLTGDRILSKDSSLTGLQTVKSKAENDRNSYVAYFTRGQSPDKCIRLYEQPTPDVFPTLDAELVVQIEASTISQSDCCVRRGLWWAEKSEDPLNLPIVPGVAFCGVVWQDCKSSRSGLKRGDRVISLVRVGANSRFLCIHKDKVVKIPASLDSKSLACLPEIYLAAFQSLHVGQRNAARYRSKSLAKQSVLILGGDNLLGKAIISLAVAANVSAVYATCASENFEEIEGAGAIPLSHDPDEWFSLVEGRLDRVIGAKNFSSTKSELKTAHVKCLNKNGTIMKVGPPGHYDLDGVPLDTLDPSPKALKTNRSLHHYNVFDAWEKDPKLAKRDLSHLVRLVEEGTIAAPTIQETVSLNGVARVQEKLSETKQAGFFLCNPWSKIEGVEDDVEVTPIYEKEGRAFI